MIEYRKLGWLNLASQRKGSIQFSEKTNTSSNFGLHFEENEIQKTPSNLGSNF